MLDELERRLLEPGVALFRGEAWQQLGEQGAATVALAGLAERYRQEQAQLEIVRDDLPRPLQRLDARRLLLEPLVRAHQQACGGLALLQLQRPIRHRRQRLPSLRRGEPLTQGQEGLVGPLDLAIQGAGHRQEVFHRRAGPGLAQARGALVAREDHQVVALGILREGFESVAVFGSEVCGLGALQDRGQGVANGHAFSVTDGSARKGTHYAPMPLTVASRALVPPCGPGLSCRA